MSFWIKTQFRLNFRIEWRNILWIIHTYIYIYIYIYILIFFKKLCSLLYLLLVKCTIAPAMLNILWWLSKVIHSFVLFTFVKLSWHLFKMHIISYSKVVGSSRALTPQWFFHMIWLRLTSAMFKNGESVFRFAIYFSFH